MNKIDLNEKIDILHNFAYENQDRNLTEKIHGKISLGDIKFSNKSKVIDSLKEQSLGGLKLVNFLPLSNTIMMNHKTLPISLFFSPYINDKDTKDSKDSNNIDSTLSYLFSPFVINKTIPNLLLPLVNFDIKFSSLPTPIICLPVFKGMEKKINQGKYSDIMSIRIRENFNKMSSLNSILNSNSSVDMRPIIFQTIYSMAKLEEEYKGFRHNSLDSYNIYISNETKPIKYEFNGKNYYVDIKKNMVKIGNFGNSYIPKMFKSSNIDDKKYKMMGNDMFDIHYFLNTLVSRDMKKANLKDKKELMSFIDRVLPKKYRGSNKNDYYMIEKAKLPSYQDILNDEYFNVYTIKNKQEIKIEISTEEERKMEMMLGLESETTEGIRKIKQKSKKIKKQEGGYVEHNKPMKNNPNLSNDKRETFKKKIAEQPKPREPPVLLEQKIYNPDTSKPSRPQPVQPFVPINQANGMPFVNYPYPYAKVLNKVPIQKIYNITIGDPSVTGNYIGEFFEDMLPGSPYTLNSLSLEDRIRLRGYVRNILIEKMDGEEMNIVGGEKSFRKYVKWGPFNPYSLAPSPYDDIATRFCLYSVFYPMRYDNEKKSFHIAKDAQSYNLRTYDLSVGSLYSDRLTDEMKLENFNVFRELTYYRYIMSEIINKKVSPNFVNMILYKVDNETRIKYDKLVEVKMRHLPKALRDLAYKPLDLVASVDEQIRNAKAVLDALKVKYPNETMDSDVLNSYIKDIIDNPEYRKEAEKLLYSVGLTMDDVKIVASETKEDKLKMYRKKMGELKNMLYMFGIKKENIKLNTESKRSLVVMTEGPTHNILRWTSPIYNKNGAQNTMIATGYHTTEAWMSVFFQILHTMIVLTKHQIYFRELSLDKNIFIKDVYHDSGNIGYWKYNVDGHSYYVPNHGYIVMFDTSYSDKVDVFNMKNSIDSTDFEKIRNQENYKLISPNMFNSNEEFVDEITKNFKQKEFNDKLRQEIGNMLNPEKLIIRLKQMKAILPPQEVTDMLSGLHRDYISGKELIDLLPIYFSKYLHTRIGTSLSRNEMMNVSMIPVRNLMKGKMLIYQERYGEYKWAMYIRQDNINGKHIIIDSHKGGEKSVFLASLRSYPENLKLEQTFKQGHRFMDEDLIDVYEL